MLAQENNAAILKHIPKIVHTVDLYHKYIGNNIKDISLVQIVEEIFSIKI